MQIIYIMNIYNRVYNNLQQNIMLTLIINNVNKNDKKGLAELTE